MKAQFDIHSVPLYQQYKAEFLQNYNSSKLDWIYDENKIQEIIDFFPLDAGDAALLKATIHIVQKNPALLEMVQLWNYLIFDSPDREDLNPYGWTMPEGVPEETEDMLTALVLFSELDNVRAHYKRLGIPDTVVEQTKASVLQSLETHRNVLKKRGPGMLHMAWLRLYFYGNLYILGRLQYEPILYKRPYYILQKMDDQSFHVMLGSQVRVRRDGEIDGSNGIEDTDAIETTFHEDSQGWTGYVCDERGYVITDQAVTLSKDAYQMVLAPGMRALNIHITPVGKLDRDACRASMASAAAFFREYDPDTQYRGFVCFSWLLDPQLETVLNEGSNILGFQHMFRRMTVKGNDHSYRYFLFEDPDVDYVDLPENTGLQRRVKAAMLEGGRFHDAGGFIPMPE